MTDNGEDYLLVLEKVGIPQALLYIYRHRDKEVTVKTLLDNLENCTETILKAVDYLEENGFITRQKQTSFPFKHVLKLTQLGETVAQSLAQMVEAIRQNRSAGKPSGHPDV